jgi:hypothetical protein
MISNFSALCCFAQLFFFAALQVLNEPQDDWGWAVLFGYGKFTTSTYPYIVWEPSDQPTILSTAGASLRFILQSVTLPR